MAEACVLLVQSVVDGVSGGVVLKTTRGVEFLDVGDLGNVDLMIDLGEDVVVFFSIGVRFIFL